VTKKVYYEKVGRKYVPIAEYDSDYLDSFPKGTHIVMSYPGGTSRRYNIDPAFGPMIAAGRYCEDTIATAIVKASELRPSKSLITEEQRVAWARLSAALGEESHALQWPAARDAAVEAVKVMQEEADKLLSNPTVKNAWDKFMMVCELTKNAKHTDI